jgi:hypothetical protein
MRFALNSDHRDFYAKQGMIEFEDLLSIDAVEKLQQEIDSTLCARLRIPPSRLHDQSSLSLYESGFDLWRASNTIKRTLFKTTLSEIASQLFQAQIFRIGFDQYLCTANPPPFSTSLSLNGFSCAHPLLGGLLLRLSEPTSESSTQLIPSKAGSGVFFSPDKIISWKELFSQPDLRMILIAYAPKKTFYRLEKNDPHTHRWKGLGYVFGDLLKDNLHPIIYR